MMDVLTGRLSGAPNTNNYENLTNKPMINGVELVGNKTAEELGLGTGNGGIDSPVGDFISREELQIMLQDMVTSSELADALAVKADFNTVNQVLLQKADISAMNTALEQKVSKVLGKGLSSNDFTTEEKEKLAGIEAGAQVNLIMPSNVSDLTNDAGYQTAEQVAATVKAVESKIPDLSAVQQSITDLENRLNGLVNGNEVAY